MDNSWIMISAVFGCLAAASLIIVLVMLAIGAIEEKLEERKRAYIYKHRFDKEPTAACYCIDCVNHGVGPFDGSCGLPGVDRLTGDNEFCYHA